MPRFDARYIVGPVAKAGRVLDFVLSQVHEVTLAEVVAALDLPKTTVFRYLQTLSAAGLIQYDHARDRYCAGERFRTLARHDALYGHLRHAARAEMARIAACFGETVNLGVLAQGHIVYVDILEQGCSEGQKARVGHRHPVYSTALGRAIAACLPPAELAALYQPRYEPRTWRTVADGRALRRQIEEARVRGYAFEEGENEDGLTCIGVPILDPTGHPVAAMSVTAPDRRMRHRYDSVAPALTDAAPWVTSHLPPETFAERA